jgi:hypothetical protein
MRIGKGLSRTLSKGVVELQRCIVGLDRILTKEVAEELITATHANAGPIVCEASGALPHNRLHFLDCHGRCLPEPTVGKVPAESASAGPCDSPGDCGAEGE